MKLLKVELENLNSLYGRHSVDFEKDLQGAPIFLIIGPTGAGKSTLMDAMSLALFGQTPRLTKGKSEKDLENDSRQVMSRGTYFAFSQLIFSKREDNKIVKYRVTWQCERAYKKPDGNFKDPRRILECFNEDLSDWEQLISDTRPKFYEPIFNKVLENLTVEDFKRMVLLAQGEFAAFLKANEEERAAILERITNTEIYKSIGKKASEKKKIIEEKYNEINIKINGINILSFEIENDYKNKKQSISDEIKILDEKAKSIDYEINWRVKENELQKKLSEAEKSYQEYLENLKNNQDFLNRLSQFKKFQKSIELYFQENENKEKIGKIEIEINNKNNEILSLKDIIIFIKSNINQLFDYLQNEKKNFEEKKYEIDKAKELRSIKNTLTEDFNKKLEKLKNLEIEKSSVFLNKEFHIKNLRIANESKKEFENVLKNELSFLLLNYKKFLLDFEKIKAHFESIKRDLIAHSIPFENPHDKLNDLRNLKDKYFSEKIQIEKVAFYIEDLSRRESEENSLVEKLKAAQQSLLNANVNYLSQKEIINNENSEVANLKSDVTKLSWKIELAYQRKHLLPGEECPLCGSYEHPYFEDMSYKKADMEIISQHEFLSQQLLEKENFQNSMLSNLLEFEKNVQFYTHEIKSVENQKNSLTNVIQDKKNIILSALNLDSYSASKKSSDYFYQIYNKLEIKNKEEIEKVNVEIKFLTEKIEEYNKNKELYIESKEKNNKFIAFKQDLNDLMLYLIPDFKIDLFEKSLVSHSEFEKIYVFEDKRYYEKYRTIENNISLYTNKLNEFEKEYVLIEKNIQDRSLEVDEIKNKINNIIKNINNFFGGEDPIKIEDKLNKSIIEKQNKLDQEKTILAEKEKIFAVLNNQKENYFHQLVNYRENLSSIKVLLDSEILKFGNLPKEEILNFNLSEIQVIEYNNIYSKLEELRISTTETKQQRYFDLENHKNHYSLNFVNSTLNDLYNNKNILDSDIKDKLKELGEITNILFINEQNKKKIEDYQQQNLEIQQEFVLWNKMHQLIGINNGENFKKFAQILNLEELIFKANYHLYRFDKRYTLAPALDAENKPRLAFAIQDSYHANALRSFKTLSGGETFLVSLALALALSEYRSIKMPIETLLLDEGFGTLDPETLQVAIGALESLHANGTQVGIISHVDSLREAIGTRIVVQKIGNGHSLLRVELN